MIGLHSQTLTGLQSYIYGVGFSYAYSITQCREIAFLRHDYTIAIHSTIYCVPIILHHTGFTVEVFVKYPVAIAIL